MSVIQYLPERNEFSAKLAKVLENYESDLYVVGSAARKVLYGLNLTPNDYNFVLSGKYSVERIAEILEESFPNAVKECQGYVKVDCGMFDASITCMPIDKFLRTVRFAGDGLAVYVPDGRPIVLPEYMTMPPIVQIVKVDDKADQANKEWLSKHLVSLTRFQDELFKAVNDELAKKESNEPVAVATD